jgi:hypothetical protein
MMEELQKNRKMYHEAIFAERRVERPGSRG